MNKTIAVIAATLAAAASFAAEYHWRGNAPDMTANGKSGNWADASNWTDASGNAVADYPHVAGDVAVFHGMAMGGYALIKSGDSIEIGELRFAEGNSMIACDMDTHVSVARLVVSNSAVFEFASNDNTPHWESDDFKAMTDFKIGNRSEVLYGGSGLVKGSLARRNYSGYSERVGYLTIDADGNLVPTHGPESPEYSVANQLEDEIVEGTLNGLFYAGWGEFRGIFFPLYGGMEAPTRFVLPSGHFYPLSWNSYVGKPSDALQGEVSTSDAKMYFWSYAKLNETGNAYIGARILAPEFINASHSTSRFYGDHSADEVSMYRVVAGSMVLSSSVPNGSASNVVATNCVMNAAAYEIGWDATLDVACANALNAASTINVKSYNGKKGDFGTINLAYGGTVNKLLVDGAELDAGTYGATGSGAANIRDDIFTGTGVLTVTAGEGGDEPPVVETNPLVIYFE